MFGIFLKKRCYCLLFAGLSLSNTLYAGVAMCEHKSSSPADVIYRVLSNHHKSSYHIEQEVRAQIKQARGEGFKGYPSCSRFVPPSTYDGSLWNYKVARVERMNYEGKPKVTYAIGFGANLESANKDLVEDIKAGDWGWIKKHGYEVVATGELIEPNKHDACYQLVLFRDKELIKRLDKTFKWQSKIEKSHEMISKVYAEIDSQGDWAKFIRVADAMARSLDAVAKAVSGYAPPGADVTYAAGSLAGTLVNTYKRYGKVKSLKKAVEGDVLSAAKVAAEAIASKSQPIGYALKVKATNVQVAIDVVKTVKNDKEWRDVIGRLEQQIKAAEKDLQELERQIVTSSERLAIINETKNFIDQTCH